jgi:5'-nucleotidase
MHFLLTNDDGIQAPGLAALEQAIQLLPDAICTTVAPAAEQSQCGHRVTTREPIVASQLAARRYQVAGTPADCVRIALFGLGLRPDFVVSGVNPGGNMGQDLHISGTVAGAREAAFHGLPAAAISHYLIGDLAVDWSRVTTWTRDLLRELLGLPLADGEFWNVNYPHIPPGPSALPPRVGCTPCRAPLAVSYEAAPRENSVIAFRYTATYSSRPVEADSDVAICFGGGVAVSRLHV